MPRHGSSLVRVGALAVGLTLAVAATAARAHEVGGSRFDAPIPLSLLFVGAGATVGATALWLARTSRAPEVGRERRVLTLSPQAARVLGGAVRLAFAAAVALAVLAGLVGRQVAAENAATLFVWPVWFRGVGLLAVVLGNPWSLLSPWRAVHAALERLEGDRLSLYGAYPAWLGVCPALIGFLLLVGVFENLTVAPLSPRLTAVVVAGYGSAMVGGAVLFGTPWLRNADPLGVLYRLLGRVAPVSTTTRGDGSVAVSVRAPWRDCRRPVEGLSVAGFVVVTVYTVSFDGFSSTPEFQRLLFGTRDLLGTGPATSVALYLAGSALFVALFLAVAVLVERLGEGSTTDWRGGAHRFAPTVLPIAAAYEVAHNYPYVLGSLGQLVAVAVRQVVGSAAPLDPLGWLSLPAFWGSQVALVVAGHVVAVVAAHGIATRRYGVDGGRRGHLPLVVLMVGYTVLSLWVVSRPVVAT